MSRFDLTPELVGAELRRRGVWEGTKDWEGGFVADRAGTYHHSDGHCGGGREPVGGSRYETLTLEELLERDLCPECALCEMHVPATRARVVQPKQLVVGAVVSTQRLLTHVEETEARMRNNRRVQQPLTLATTLRNLAEHQADLQEVRRLTTAVRGATTALEGMVADLEASRTTLLFAGRSRRYVKTALEHVAGQLSPTGHRLLLDEEPLLVGMHPAPRLDRSTHNLLEEELAALFQVTRAGNRTLLALPRYAYDVLQRSRSSAHGSLQAVRDDGTCPETLVALWAPESEGPLVDLRRAAQAARLV